MRKFVFFFNLQKNRSNKHISLITKIVLVILLVCVISDKSGAFNISQNFSKLNTMSVDYFANEILMLSKMSFNYSFTIALSLVGILVGTLFALCCYMVSANKNVETTGSVNECSYTIETAKNLRTNNIYLINNKFIC